MSDVYDRHLAAYTMTPHPENGSANGSTPNPVDAVGGAGRGEGKNELPLDRNSKGELRANLNNVTLILEHDPRLAGLVWFDEFLQRLMTGDPAREWKDVDDIDLTLHIQRDCEIPNIGGDIVAKAVIASAHRNRRNCVKSWLESLTWDGEPRLDQFFSEHFGAICTPYTMAAGRNFWISMPARIYSPGCQVDHMPVLEGSQGIGKSRALRVIGGDWYAEQHESASHPKAFAEIIQGKLLVEISEMDSFNRAEVTRVKQVITCTSDRYRVSYGRHAQDHARQGVFAGTTNRDDWNRDETGARRFWPIACKGGIDVDAIRSDRDQLFAEAVHRFKAKETWWEMPAEETRSEQQKRFDADIWTEAIAEYVALKGQVTVTEILTQMLKFEEKECDRRNQMRVATCLHALGWKKGDGRVNSRVVKVWKPNNEA